ncbi:MAG: VWA domain-containing protein [Lysobacterales bacterium]
MKCSIAIILATITLLASPVRAQLNPPPTNIDHFFTSSGGADYYLRNDDDPTNQGLDEDGKRIGDYYPNAKLFMDTLAVDRLGINSIGNPRGYHEAYTDIGNTPFGFLETLFSGGQRNIWYWDCSNLDGDDCDNGGARFNAIHIPAPLYRVASNSCVRMVLGHEMAHMWQRAYYDAGAPGGLGKWVTEGQARALQDKFYLDLDTDPEASCVLPYLGQVNGYLAGKPSKGVLPDTNKPLWSLSYDAALFWTYLMEQTGIIADEPLLGVDFLVTWWDKALEIDDGAGSMEITEAAIQEYYPDRTLLGEFRRFVLANLVKDMDLSNESPSFRQRYSYRDEEQVADSEPDHYAEVGFVDSATVTGGSDGTVNFFSDHYAVQYFDFDVSGCVSNRILRVDFDPTSSVFGTTISKLGAWGVVVGQGGSAISSQQPARFYKKIDEEWAVEFQQPANPYENIYVTTTGVQGPVAGVVTVECNAPDTLGPDLPLLNPIDPLTPGPPQNLTLGPVGPVTLPPQRRGVSFENLDPTQFEVVINGKNATVAGGLNTSEGYQLYIEHPPQDSAGPHDVSISFAGLESTFSDAVYYRDPRDNRWVYVLMDQSLSMGNPSTDPKLASAIAATKDYLNYFDQGADFRAGLISYAINAQTRTTLAPYDSNQQADFEAALDNLTPLGPESAVGSAIELARTSFASFSNDEPSGRPAKKEILLFSDGPLSIGPDWDEVSNDVITAGITIHTIALGQTADQPLLARIARETGGTYRYVTDDAAVPSDGVEASEMVQSVLKLGGGRERQQIGGSSQPLAPDSTLDFSIVVPNQAVGLLLPAVQAAREAVSTQSMISQIRVLDPAGNVQPSRFDGRVISLLNQGALEPGQWRLSIDTTGDARGDLIVQAFTRLAEGPWLETALNLPSEKGQISNGFVAGEVVEYEGQATYEFTAFAESDLLQSTVRINDLTNRNSEVALETVTIVTDQLQRVALKNGVNLKGGVRPTEEIFLNYSKVQYTPNAGSPTGFTNEFSQGQRGTINFEQRAILSQPNPNGGSVLKIELVGHQSAAIADVGTGGTPADGDFDGLPDRYEARHECLDANFQDGSGDADDDQLFNIQEYERNTDPCDSDTDGGGELDGSEVQGGRDPLFAKDDALRGAELAFIDHELTHVVQQGGLADNSMLIKLPRSPSYGSLTLKRGVVDGPLQPVATLTGNQLMTGEYVDRGLTPGQTYCYQIQPADGAGNVGRASRIFCRTARAQPELPWGDIVINDGNPRTSNPLLNLQLSMYNKDPSSISMRFGINTEPDGEGIPFSSRHQLQLPAVSFPTEVTISVGYFSTGLGPDPAKEDETIATESITLMPPQSTGSISLRLTLFNPDGTPMLDPSQSQAMVQICAAGISLSHCKEPTTYPDENGNVMCDELKPGDYDVYPMGNSVNTVPIRTTVVADQTTEIGDVAMTIGELFKSGFEGNSIF